MRVDQAARAARAYLSRAIGKDRDRVLATVVAVAEEHLRMTETQQDQISDLSKRINQLERALDRAGISREV